ncbi:MAG: hypothetical protein M3Z84_00485 [Actinomycetota bacterium]|nr:hypothetical protein [Actinomycetota bacterium]
MSLEERALHELHTGLEEVLGPERAATLMSRLPAAPWPDVVTKSYLDEKLAVVDDTLTSLEEKLTLVVEARIATHHAALSDQITNQTRTMIFALLSTLVMVTALLLAIR